MEEHPKCEWTYSARRVWWSDCRQSVSGVSVGRNEKGQGTAVAAL